MIAFVRMRISEIWRIGVSPKYNLIWSARRVGYHEFSKTGDNSNGLIILSLDIKSLRKAWVPDSIQFAPDDYTLVKENSPMAWSVFYRIKNNLKGVSPTGYSAFTWLRILCKEITPMAWSVFYRNKIIWKAWVRQVIRLLLEQEFCVRRTLQWLDQFFTGIKIIWKAWVRQVIRLLLEQEFFQGDNSNGLIYFYCDQNNLKGVSPTGYSVWSWCLIL
jgi:hypothetical protein